MGKRVIYINPVSMSNDNWVEYLEDVKNRISSGEEVNNLLVPLSRHSTLPELQAFVKLFRPKRIVPNTLDPRLLGIDWAYIDRIFASCLHPSSQTAHTSTLRLRLGISAYDTLKSEDENDCDVALKNLVGDGAADVAERWADQGRLLKKLAYVRSHLGGEENEMIDQLLGIKNQRYSISQQAVAYLNSGKGKGKEPQSSPPCAKISEEDSDLDSDDERGRTAHKLFASLAGIDSDDKENAWWMSSPMSQLEQGNEGVSKVLDSAKKKVHGEPIGDGAWRVNRLTPKSSPVRQKIPLHEHRPQTSSGVPIASSSKPPLPFNPIAERNPIRPMPTNRGKERSLQSLICVASSSSPDISDATHKDANSSTRRISAMANIKGPLARDKSVFLSKPRALVFHPTQLPSRITSKRKNKSTTISERVPHPSHRKPPEMTSTDLFDHSKSFNASTTMKRKWSPPDASTSRGASSKKRCRDSSPRGHPVAEPSQAPSIDTPTPKPIVGPPRLALANRKYVHETLSPIPFVPNEREMHHLRRLETARQLAITYPHLVAPSYPQKRERQLAQWNRRTRERVAAAVGNMKTASALPSPSGARSGVTPAETKSALPTKGPAGPNERKLGLQRTILSFETVHDEDEASVDWNRSNQLADAIREDVANGRRPVIPPLLSAQSQSQSFDTD